MTAIKYPCRGECFESQMEADAGRSSGDAEVYRCTEGHWHWRLLGFDRDGSSSQCFEDARCELPIAECRICSAIAERYGYPIKNGREVQS